MYFVGCGWILLWCLTNVWGKIGSRLCVGSLIVWSLYHPHRSKEEYQKDDFDHFRVTYHLLKICSTGSLNNPRLLLHSLCFVFSLQKPYLDGLSDGDPLSVHSEERRILEIKNINILDFDNLKYQLIEGGKNNVLHQYGRTASQCYICPMTLRSQEIGEQRDMECFPIFVAIPPFTDDTLHIETKPYSSLVHEQSRCLSLMNQERVNPDVFLRCWTNQCGNNQSR